MRIAALMLLLLAVAGCSGTAELYPENDAARAIGLPTLAYEKRMGGGPVTITLPDGTVLHGHYAMINNGGFGTTSTYGAFGSQSATAYVVPGTRPVEIDATNGKLTIECEAGVNFSGSGAGGCTIQPGGAQYRIVF